MLNTIEAGSATVQQTQTTTTVNQTSQKAIINWNSFNIGQGEHTHFQQPAGGSTLNRINPGNGVSEIYGKLTSTGQVILVNPAGFYFGPNAYVNVGGIIASTANISNEDFLNNYYRFSSDTAYHGAIVNEGQIIAAEHGLIALVGGAVRNDGMIQATTGNVVIGAAEAYTITFDGNHLVSFTIDKGISKRATDKNGNELSDGVDNQGTILANGGRVLVSAQSAAGVLDRVVNTDGIVRARSVSKSGGDLVFSGGSNGVVRIAGNVDASGKSDNHSGGNITVTGENILLDSGAILDVSGNGGAGNMNIGGNYLGQGPLPNSNALVMATGAQIYADVIYSGNGGRIILWSDNYTNVNGLISARGGQADGNGGFIETSSKNILNVGELTVDTSAANGQAGTWLLDPVDITISATPPDSGGSFDGGSPDNTFTPTGNANILNTTLNSNLESANVIITTSGAAGGTGNITINAPISWSSNYFLRLLADNNIIINDSITAINGGLELSAVNSSMSITTGAGGHINVGNFDLLQGQWHQINATLPEFNVYNSFTLNSDSAVNVSDVQFIRAIGGDGTTTPLQLTDIYGFQGIGSSTTTLAYDYELVNNIDATNTRLWNDGKGFRPIGHYIADAHTTKFSGELDGNNYAIENIFIHRDNDNAQGEAIFAVYRPINTSKLIHDIIIKNPDITATGRAAGLVAFTDWQNSISTSADTYRNINVIGGSIKGGFYAGGILAYFGRGLLTDSYTSASVYADYAGGAVGFVEANATVENVYSTGDVYGNSNGSEAVGGLVSVINNGGTVTQSYSTGKVTPYYGSGGGLVGDIIAGGTLTNSFWDTETSQQGQAFASNAGTVTNVTGGCFDGTSCAYGGTADLSARTTFSSVGWDISSTISTNATAPTSTWFIFEGRTRPMLMAEYNTNINTEHQLQLAGSTLGASYTQISHLDFTNNLANSAEVWGTNSNISQGLGFYPIGNTGFDSTADGFEFSGSYNGQGHGINGIYINNPSTTTESIGLFGGVTGSASLTNISIIDANIAGSSFTGALAGQVLTGGATIDSIYISGSVTANFQGGARASGSMIGAVYDATSISNTYSTASFTDDLDARNGALIGYLENSPLSNSYATGSLSNDQTSGLVGYNMQSTISDSFWDSATTGTTSGVGTNDNGTLNNVVAGTFDGSSGINLSQASSYTNWDITNTPSSTANKPSNKWFIIDGSTRPILLSEWTETVSTPHQLQLMHAALGADYTIKNNINLSSSMNNSAEIWATNQGNNSGAGFFPIAGDNTGSLHYTGYLNGQKFNIKNLYINTTSSSDIGLIARANNDSSIINIGVTSASVNTTNCNNCNIGVLLGSTSSSHDGFITNTWATGSISSSTLGTSYIGGSIGLINGADTVLYDIYANTTISNTSTSGQLAVGGVLGAMLGSSASLSNAVSVSNLTSTMNASGTQHYTGGLIGYQGAGAIQNSYSVGDVTATSPSATTSFASGGLIGRSEGNLSMSYTSSIMNSTNTLTGSVIGYNVSGTNTNIYFDSDTTNTGSSVGSGSSAGISSLTTAQMIADDGNFTGFDITASGSTGISIPTNTWIIFEGNTRPMLLSEWSNILQTPHQVQLMAAAQQSNYVLGQDIDFANAMSDTANIWVTNRGVSGDGFDPVLLRGKLDGRGYSIENLYINRPTSPDTGLLAQISIETALVNNINMTDATVTGGGTTGILAGRNSGRIANVYTSGTVNSGPNTSYFNTGGIVGLNSSNIVSSHNAASVASYGPNLGGVAGASSGGSSFMNFVSNSGTIGDSNANSSIGGVVGFNFGRTSNSFNEGLIDLTGATANTIGGIAGTNATASGISNSYNVGNIIGGTSDTVGGAIGSNIQTVSNIFSTGLVTSTGSNIGGLVGSNSSTVTNGFWNTETSGQASSAAGTGKTTSEMKQSSTFTSWDFDDIWGNISGTSYPYLRAFYPDTPRVISGTSTANANSAVSVIANNSIINTVRTTDDGAYYGIFTEKYIGASTRIADDVRILVMLNDSNQDANSITLTPDNGASITALSLVSNQVSVVSASASTLTNTNLGDLISNITDDDILFSVSNNNITFDNNIDFNVDSNTTYNINGNLTMQGSDANLTISGGLVLSSAGLSLSVSSTTNEISGVISGSNDLIKDGSGTLILSAVNTYTGNTTINEGTLQLGTNNAIPDTTNLMIGANSSFNMNGFNNDINTLTGSGDLLMGAGGDMGIISTSTNTFDGDISGSNLADIGLTNGGTIILTGDNSGFLGQVGIANNSTIRFTNDASYFSSASSVNITNNSTIELVDTNINYTGTPTFSVLGLTDSTITVINGGTGVSSIGDGYALFPIGGSNTISVNSGASLIIQEDISNNGSITKTGAGSLTLSGSNTYSGTTTVNQGNVFINNVQGLGTTAGNTTINGGTLTINNVNVGAESMILSGGTLNGDGTASLSGAITVSADSEITAGTGEHLTLSGTINGANELTISGDGMITLDGIVGGSTALSALTSTITTLNIDGGAITTTGAQNYESAVLGATTTLAGSSVTSGSITGDQDLVINSANTNLSGSMAVGDLTITGTGATNTFTFNTGSMQTFDFTGTDQGTMTNDGISGTGLFSNVQNLTGGDNNDNTFIFTDGDMLTGTLDGGSLTNTNLLDYSNYPLVTVELSNTNDGITKNASDTQINNFVDITNLLGNPAQENILVPPAGKTSIVVYTGERSGYINDPIFFVNFGVLQSSNLVTRTDIAAINLQGELITAELPQCNNIHTGYDLNQSPTCGKSVSPTIELTPALINILQEGNPLTTPFVTQDAYNNLLFGNR